MFAFLDLTAPPRETSLSGGLPCAICGVDTHLFTWTYPSAYATPLSAELVLGPYDRELAVFAGAAPLFVITHTARRAHCNMIVNAALNFTPRINMDQHLSTLRLPGFNTSHLPVHLALLP